MIYLIHGENEYKIDENIKRIIGENKELEVVTYDMTISNIKEALEDALTISLFSSDKIIICKNSIFLTNEKCDIDHDLNYLLDFLKISTNTILIIVNNEIDKRKKITKELLKYNVVECNDLKEYELINYVKDYCKINKYKIDNDALNLFINKLNNNIYIINNELNKLFIYKEDKVITKKDVEEVTSRLIKTDIFELINSVVKKDIDKSLELYDDLLKINEEEIKLIITLANQFRLIYQVKIMTKDGYTENLIAQDLDVHPYRVKLAKEIDIMPFEALNYLEKLATIDEQIKKGLIDKKQAFKKFILDL